MARQMIPSPDVKNYDSTPAMSLEKLTAEIIANLNKGFGSTKEKPIRNWQYDFSVLNFAAPDMIVHTGNLSAGIACCQVIDKYLETIVKAYLKLDGTIMVTADHGNIEEMINLATGEIDTEHSINPVPFILINRSLANKIKLKPDCVLGDIAPTVLEMLNYKKPKEMTGKSLII